MIEPLFSGLQLSLQSALQFSDDFAILLLLCK
uniref:Uncharacterized protein n=1 Tax=Klebsiella pneumoniae CG43 TaxID=1244085 RepID=Q6U5J4_KLEPN|nr:hypothetical protein LV022 [Klebsiella pneumoniae CG43]